MKYNNIAQTLKGNGCYAGPIGEARAPSWQPFI
jgi:hypothetical protein